MRQLLELIVRSFKTQCPNRVRNAKYKLSNSSSALVCIGQLHFETHQSSNSYRGALLRIALRRSVLRSVTSRRFALRRSVLRSVTSRRFALRRSVLRSVTSRRFALRRSV